MLKYRLWRIKKSLTFQTAQNLQYKRLNIEVEQKSTKVINLVGYVILTVVMLNYTFLLASAQLANSNWVHSTAGTLVENGWGLLLGFLFIFYRRDQDIIKPREFFLIKFISWLALIIGIAYFLTAPLIIGNAFRLSRNYKAQVVHQIDTGNSQIKQYSAQLDQATDVELASLLEDYQKQAPELNISSSQQLKATLLQEVQQRQNKIKKDLQAKLSQQKKNLFKTTMKWSMIATLTGMCFTLIWNYTKWARGKY